MAEQPQEENLEPARMDRLVVGILWKGPKHSSDDSPELNARHQAHLRHLQELYKDGKMLLAGPTPDSPEGLLRGICLFYNTTPEEASARMANDPQVKAGHFTYQVMTWFVPHGKMDFEQIAYTQEQSRL